MFLGPSQARSLITASLALAAWAAAAEPAGAVPGQPCATADASLREPDATDVRFVLDAAAGVRGLCGPCLCDTDGNGTVTVGDALVTLQRAVGNDVELRCPDCTCRAAVKLNDVRLDPDTTAVDIDTDGYVDLLWGNGGAAVMTQRGLGRGVFNPPMATGVGRGRNATLLAVGDVTGDSIHDLVISSRTPEFRSPLELSVVPGIAAGGFGEEVFSPEPAEGRAEAVDLNGDGNVDLIIGGHTSNTAQLLVMMGDGTGAFVRNVDAVENDAVNHFETALVDDDEHADLLTLRYGTIHLYRGLGDGTFGEAEIAYESADRARVRHFTTVDLDGGGTSDIIVAIPEDLSVGILPGIGDGSFGALARIAVGGQATYVLAPDLNSDGSPDLVVAMRDADVVALLQRADGTFATPVRYRARPNPDTVLVLDANNDGAPDVLVNSRPAKLLLGRGDGTFLTETESRTGAFIQGTGLGDYDGDRVDDFVSGEISTVSAYRGNGAGGYTGRSSVEIDGFPEELAVDDLDGDGMADILVERQLPLQSFVAGAAALPGPAFHMTPSYAAYFVFGGGDGSLSAPARIEGLTNNGMAFGDVDGDGHTDVAAIDALRGSIDIFLGTGDAGFTPGPTLRLRDRDGQLLLLDADRDGRDDLFLHEHEAEVTTLWMSLPDGTFHRPRAFTTDRLAMPAIGDLDADGQADLLFGLPSQNYTAVYHGRGGARFAQDATLLPVPRVRLPQLADLDDDGALDLVHMPSTDLVAIVRGDGHGGFGPTLYISTASSERSRSSTPITANLGDLDENGTIDILVTHSTIDPANITFLPDPGHCLLPSMMMPMPMPPGGGGGD